MAPNEKKPGTAKGKPVDETRAAKRRLAYLKVRAKEMKQEMQAIKNESTALREKLGMGAKKKPKKADKGGGDDDDE